MKLTRRQEEVIQKLLDLYYEMRGPIHYSVLAEALGVSPITAYDMLRLLEEKGLVTSEYQLAAQKSGPGRTERVFAPTALTNSIVQQMEDFPNTQNWQELKVRILNKIQEDEDEVASSVVRLVLERIPPDGDPQVRYCIDVMTVMALQIREQAASELLCAFLPEILPENQPVERASLCLLGGFSLGILAPLEANLDPEWKGQLLEHVYQYQQTLLKMSMHQCQLVGEHLKSMFSHLGTT